MHTWLVATMLLAVSGTDDSAECHRDSEGYCSSRRVMIELAAQPDSRTVLINVALGDVVTLRIAPPLEVKTCKLGEKLEYCGLANGNGSLLALAVAPGLIKMTPLVPSNIQLAPNESATDALWDENGNVQIVFTTGHQINIEVHIRPPAQAVKQLFVSSAELVAQAEAFEIACEKHMSKRAQDVRDAWNDFDATVERHVRERMGREVMGGVLCSYVRRTNMASLLWAQVTSFCRVGSALHVVTTVENRSETSVFVPDTVRLLADDSDDAAAVAADVASVVYREKVKGPEGTTYRDLDATDIELRYGDRIETTVSIPAAGAPKQLALEIRELGGAQRVVRIGRIGF